MQFVKQQAVGHCTHFYHLFSGLLCNSVNFKNYTFMRNDQYSYFTVGYTSLMPHTTQQLGLISLDLHWPSLWFFALWHISFYNCISCGLQNDSITRHLGLMVVSILWCQSSFHSLCTTHTLYSCQATHMVHLTCGLWHLSYGHLPSGDILATFISHCNTSYFTLGQLHLFFIILCG